MAPKLLLHIFVLGLWGGCVFAEVTMELLAVRTPVLRPALARFHHAIDYFVEIPILFAILASGVWLYDPGRSSPLLWVKISAGLVAIGANFLCVIPVTLRKRAADAGDVEVMQLNTRRIFLAVAVGLPSALLALSLGLYLDSFP